MELKQETETQLDEVMRESYESNKANPLDGEQSRIPRIDQESQFNYHPRKQ